MNTFFNIIKIVAVIIGTIIGAGFASGKEIYIFFAQYGKNGLIGALISSILTAMIIYSTILIIKKFKIKNNNDFIEQISNNERKTEILKNIINIFLIVSFWVMCSGFCTFFKQELGIPMIITAILNATLMYILLIKNMDGIIRLNLIVVPIMIAIIIIVSIKNYPITSIINENASKGSFIKSIISAILYTSYNSITLIPIIISLAEKVNNKKTSKIIIILTTTIIFILIIAIYQMLTLCKIDIKNIEIPVLEILNTCTPIEKNVYSIAIITAIITSAISSGYAVLENIKDSKKYKRVALIICILEIPIAYIGFGKLVTILYPSFGIIGMIQIIYILKRAKSIAKSSKN